MNDGFVPLNSYVYEIETLGCVVRLSGFSFLSCVIRQTRCVTERLDWAYFLFCLYMLCVAYYGLMQHIFIPDEKCSYGSCFVASELTQSVLIQWFVKFQL